MLATWQNKNHGRVYFVEQQICDFLICCVCEPKGDEVLQSHPLKNNCFITSDTQVFRLIGIPMNTQMLSEITSRLVEVVCETAEEMQGFVTEILQTIEKAVSSLDIGVIGMLVDASLRSHTESNIYWPILIKTS